MENAEHEASDTKIAFFQSEIEKATPSFRRRVYDKFLLAALGSIPWVGGFIIALAATKTEQGDIHADDMRTQWLQEHQRKMGLLASTLTEIHERFERLGEQIDERVRSEGYLSLVRRAFRVWDHADTDEKRKYVANMVTNASGSRVCSDDVVRLFLDWLNFYHEAHFAVIREIFKEPGVTRYEIWTNIYGAIPREDSAEADLYKMLIRDLTIGGVIRQTRETTADGQFLRKRPIRRHGTPTTMESAFEDSKPYELTELGRQFVHYTMTDIVRRIGAGGGGETTPKTA